MRLITASREGGRGLLSLFDRQENKRQADAVPAPLQTLRGGEERMRDGLYVHNNAASCIVPVLEGGSDIGKARGNGIWSPERRPTPRHQLGNSYDRDSRTIAERNLCGRSQEKRHWLRYRVLGFPRENTLSGIKVNKKKRTTYIIIQTPKIGARAPSSISLIHIAV